MGILKGIDRAPAIPLFPYWRSSIYCLALDRQGDTEQLPASSNIPTTGIVWQLLCHIEDLIQ